jgi:hypothetical protein
MVKDYVVANLPKETKAFWNNKGVTQINCISFYLSL